MLQAAGIQFSQTCAGFSYSMVTVGSCALVFWIQWGSGSCGFAGGTTNKCNISADTPAVLEQVKSAAWSLSNTTDFKAGTSSGSQSRSVWRGNFTLTEDGSYFCYAL